MSDQFRPSKQFLIRGGIIIALIGIVLLVQTHWFHTLFQKKKTTTAQTPETVGDLVSKDSNGNGIPDWEEKLWGLDPNVIYTNGKSNAEIIKEKKLALGATTDATGAPTNETDAIAQQLFSITTALSQNPDVDDATLQDIATKLGSTVDISSVSNKYSLKNIHLVNTNSASLAKYYTNLTSIMGTYNSDDPDITIIINAAETGDYSQLPDLTQTGSDYTAIAQKLSAISVPIGVAQYHLDIINGFAGMAASFTYLQQMPDNGTQALVGVALYKVYSTRGNTAFYNLHDYLVKYGILSS